MQIAPRRDEPRHSNGRVRSAPPLVLRADKLDQAEKLLKQFEKLEAQLQQVRDGLTHSHRLASLGTIASMMAHEYNNILTPIVSYAQMALARPDDGDLMRKALEKTLSGCERAVRISSCLLGFAGASDERTAAPLRPTIDDTIACLAREPAKDGIDLTIDVPDVEAAIVPLKLQQVLLNLILNARQAMAGAGGGRLRISGREKGGNVTIDVADTGPGIPDDILDRLFEPFVTRRGSHGDDEHEGTGLGLCICRDLILDAGGTITVESVAGEGTTFHIVLPKIVEIETT